MLEIQALPYSCPISPFCCTHSCFLAYIWYPLLLATGAADLQELVLLLPDLASQLPGLHPKTLAVLAADIRGVAQKLIRLRLLFPSADVSQMISRRPTLLLDEEFEQVGGCAVHGMGARV